MNSLKINFENCYGIKGLQHEFSFAKQHTQLIYAPNGMMKSSFAMTLENLFAEGNEQPHDRLHSDIPAKYEVLADNAPLHEGQVFVDNPENASYDSSASFTNFLVNTALKAQYDAIYNELNKYIDRVMAPLSTVSDSTDCRKELGLRQTSWMCVKKENGVLELHAGEYQRDLFVNMLGRSNDDRVFISLIPFVRNLIEYSKGDGSQEYEKLTSCLHLKADTVSITDSEVIDIITTFDRGNTYDRIKANTSIYGLIMTTADAIVTEAAPDEIRIENKIVLSIACRLKAEQYLEKELLAAGLSHSDLETTSNQTSYWTRLFKQHCATNANKSVIERVNMMTPELIHINSFMYEPLIDMSIHHLIKLYNDCSNL